MKIRALLLVVIIALNLFLPKFVDARGGGGGGGRGGGGRGFSSGGYYGRSGGLKVKWEKGDNERLVVILLIFAALVAFLYKGYKLIIIYKKVRVNRILRKSALEDVFWDKKDLSLRIEKTFLRIQNAWMNQDLNLVEDMITKRFYLKNQKILERQKRARVFNLIDKVKVEKVEIIGIEDYNDNNLDRFTAYISGQMVDLILRSHQKNFQSSKFTNFEDLYHFVRNENVWLLDRIVNYLDMITIGELEIKKEKSE